MSEATDPRVDAYIDALPDWQQAICREVRELVHAADPEVAETIKRRVQPYFVLEGNVCALLAVVAVVLGFEMYSLLLGEAASPEEQATIRDTLAATPGIAHLLQLRTMHLAPEELLVAARFELDPDLSADDAARVIDQAQAGLREQVPSARIIYLEPELPVAPESRG